jgi:hypothetical protein
MTNTRMSLPLQQQLTAVMAMVLEPEWSLSVLVVLGYPVHYNIWYLDHEDIHEVAPIESTIDTLVNVMSKGGRKGR